MGVRNLLLNKSRKNHFNKVKLTAQEIDEIFFDFALPIAMHERTLKTKSYMQHGKTSCYRHSIAVAYYSLQIANRFKIKCDKRSLVRGALLHDYFLYDWHVYDRSHMFHGFTHPRYALKNASEDYELNKVEKNIILRHMFPFTLVPPRYKEGLIVCLADKICGFKEILKANPYPFINSFEEKLLLIKELGA